MARKPKNSSGSMLSAARAVLERLGPMATTDLAKEAGFSPQNLGRILSLVGESVGIIQGSEIYKGSSRIVWSLDPNFIPPKITKGAKGELSPQQKAERESADRIAEMLRRFRQEPPRYAGGRRHV